MSLDFEPHDELAHRITRALEAPPRVAIPAGFAARVAAQASAQTPSTLPLPSSSHFGQIASYVAFALLLAAMVLFAPWARTGRFVPVANEFLLAFEFVALMTWTSLRPGTTR